MINLSPNDGACDHFGDATATGRGERERKETWWVGESDRGGKIGAGRAASRQSCALRVGTTATFAVGGAIPPRKQ